MIPTHLADLQGQPVIYRRTLTGRTNMIDSTDGHALDADAEITVRGICDGWRITTVDQYTPAVEELNIAGYGWVDAWYVEPYVPPWHRRLAWWRNP